MKSTTFSDLTPTFFLQTFILEMMHATEQMGQEHAEQLIEQIARTAGYFFESIYRQEIAQLEDRLDRERYIELILGLKNHIGGNFSLATSTDDCVSVTNTCCPFGDKVSQFPELCRMTSSVFGGIAARNFGYAKVEIAKSIARRDGCCEVHVHLNPHTANKRSGIEYRDAESRLHNNTETNALHARIEESILKLWRRQSKQPVKKSPPTVVANSQAMKQVLQAIEVIAPTSATVLIEGQTGSGKELGARAIHAMSERCDKAFIPVNCGAIPESLMESILFGHEKGAFTGAIDVHQGFFERASGGSLFLDEIDSLSPAAQTRLLRVIQEGELERVGGKSTLSVDVRIISATNISLERKVAEQLFRQDLYYRINVVNLRIPPLMERPEDIPALVQVILKSMNEKHHKTVQSVSLAVMRKIKAYHWPGNVRELENVLEQALLFCMGEEITDIDLPETGIAAGSLDDWRQQKERVIAGFEQAFLRTSLMQCEGDVKQIATRMAISTRAVYNKLKKYRIDPDAYRSRHHDNA